MSYIRSLANGKYRAEISKNYTSIQSKTFSTQKQAESWAVSIEKNIDKILSIKPKKLKKLSPSQVEELGGLPLFQKLGVEIEFLTFKNLVNEYMKQWTSRDDNYIRRANFWLMAFNDKPVKSIKAKLKSNNTLLRMKAVLSSILVYGIDKNYLNKNCTEKVRIKAASNQIEWFLSNEERVRLIEACHESSWDKMHLLILLAITTGMRKAELSNLRWSDINFEKGLASLKDTKNGNPRINPIPSIAFDELKTSRQIGNGLIFFSPNNSEKPFDFRKQWYATLKRANINNLLFHDLRHTAASYLVMAGATLHEAWQILGHKSPLCQHTCRL